MSENYQSSIGGPSNNRNGWYNIMIKNVAKSAFLLAIYVRQIGRMYEIKCMNVVVGHDVYQGLVKIKKMYVFFGFPNF